jgi:lipopolysaccharide export system permease protein
LRLQRYILRLLLTNTLLVLVVVTAIVFLAVLVQSIGRYHDASLGLLFTRIPHLLPSALSLAIPLSILVGVLLTYGRLSADNEILALRMGGVHPFHAVSPAIVLGLVLSMVTLHLNGNLAPAGQARARQITKDDLRKLFDSLQAKRVHDFRSDRLTLHWRDVDDDGWLLDFRFEVSPADGVRLDGAAARARIAKDDASGELQFALQDLEIGDQTDEHRAEWEVLSFPIEGLFGLEAAKMHRSLMTSEDIRYRFTRAPLLGRDPDSLNLVRLQVEYYGRIGLALACLVFALVGAPVGILFRRGSFVASGFVALVVAFVVYYPLHEAGKSLAEFRRVTPALSMSIPTFVLALLGLVLLSRVLSR